jgi:hypothetical protein
MVVSQAIHQHEEGRKRSIRKQAIFFSDLLFNFDDERSMFL